MIAVPPTARAAVAAADPRGTAPADDAVACCAVIVHYRCADDLRACLASVAHHAPGLPVLVVENGAGERAFAALFAELAQDPRVSVLDAGRNLGFGGGCNLGIAAALARFPALQHVLLLNPDTLVTAGFLEALRATAVRHRAGIVGGRIVDLDGAVWFENGTIRPFSLTRAHVRAPTGACEFETGFVTGALMLVDAELLRAGLRFDESYFLYVEDVDLCAEVRARGRSLWVTTDAVVRHRGGGSQRRAPPVLGALRAEQLEHMTCGKVYFARKRLPPLQRWAVLAVAVVVKPLLGLVVARGSLAFVRPYFRGLWRGMRLPVQRG